jgi:hypothetical protein
MASRERVQAAVTASVEEATENLAELSGASEEARLRTIIDGWGRGLAAGIEELAIALDEVHRLLAEAAGTREPPEPAAGINSRDDRLARRDVHDSAPDRAEAVTEEELQAQALESRKETQALREQSESPKDDGDESQAIDE